jgi:hypothetical protein
MNRTQYDEYVTALKRHDWFYPFSDDKRVYGAGSASASRLNATAKTNPAAKEAYDLVSAYENYTARTDDDKRELNDALDEIRNTLPE